MTIKSITRAAVFIVVLVFILYTINGFLMPKYYLSNTSWPTTSSYQAFYAMEKNSIDVLFLGSSYCVNSFSPMEIYNQYGIRSFNLGSEQQSIFLSYYWLKEALRFQSPSVIILEDFFLRSIHPDEPINMAEGLIRKCLDPMRWSAVKLEAINELCLLDQNQNIKSWIFTNIRFHDRWKELGETDFTIDSNIIYSQLMGWAPGTEGYRGFEPFAYSEAEQPYPLEPLMVEYFKKMVHLCKENGIQLVLVGVPSDATDARLSCSLNAIATENAIDYIEMSEETTWAEIGYLSPKENPVGHGNIWGNSKTSQYIGRLLKDKYHVPSVTDPQYEQKKIKYEHVKNCSRLLETQDIDEYLSYLNDEDFYVFIAVYGDAVNGMRDTTKLKLKDLGFKHEWNIETDYQQSYIGIKNDEGIFEDSGGRLDKSGKFRKKRDKYSLASFGEEDGAYASIIINDREYSKYKRGMNIAVYDAMRCKIIDYVNFDTSAGSEMSR